MKSGRFAPIVHLPLNTAARLMGLCDGMQIFISEDVYKDLTGYSRDVTLDKQFRLFKDIPVKHDVKINVYQYCPADKEFVAQHEPKEVSMLANMSELSRVMPNERQLREISQRMEKMRRIAINKPRFGHRKR